MRQYPRRSAAFVILGLGLSLLGGADPLMAVLVWAVVVIVFVASEQKE